MNRYQENVLSVLSFLSEMDFCDAIITEHKKCYQRLRAYFQDLHQPVYSAEAAVEWSKSVGISESKQSKRHYGIYVARLNDVYETGAIRREHFPRTQATYKKLNPYYKSILDAYLVGRDIGKITISLEKSACARFLLFLQKRGERDISYLTPRIIKSFFEDSPLFSGNGNWRIVGLTGLMKSLSDRGECDDTCWLYLHYINFGGQFSLRELDEAQINRLQRPESGFSIPAKDFRGIAESFMSGLREQGYSGESLRASQETIDALRIFLDYHGVPYSEEASDCWLKTIGSGRTFYPKARRTLTLLLILARDGELATREMFRYKNPLESLPDWCLNSLSGFIRLKAMEGLPKNNIVSYRAACVRFIKFISAKGIGSFQDIRHEDVKRFILADKHKNARAKNAYCSKIRKFLIYLSEKGELADPSVYKAMTYSCSFVERNVEVLSADEIEEIKRYMADDDMEGRCVLRRKAMLLLGLRMGIRGCDIVRLTFDNIDWVSETVSFIQSKTSVEIRLPLLTDVGNAIWRYLKEERPKINNPHIFLRRVAPYCEMSAQVCRAALDAALPDRRVPDSGFHITRKTFATGILRNGNGLDRAVDALGHRGTNNVFRYLSLDDERMRMCTLTLESLGIGRADNGNDA